MSTSLVEYDVMGHVFAHPHAELTSAMRFNVLSWNVGVPKFRVIPSFLSILTCSFSVTSYDIPEEGLFALCPLFGRFLVLVLAKFPVFSTDGLYRLPLFAVSFADFLILSSRE
jgi:hypothetical protein